MTHVMDYRVSKQGRLLPAIHARIATLDAQTRLLDPSADILKKTLEELDGISMAELGVELDAAYKRRNRALRLVVASTLFDQAAALAS